MVMPSGIGHGSKAQCVHNPFIQNAHSLPGGLLKYELGRDVPLRLEKWTHFYTKFCRKMRPIFIPEPQILSKFTKNVTLFSKIVKL